MPRLHSPKIAKRKKVLVGSRATMRSGNSSYQVEILEDRGPIGYGGRQIVLIRVIDDTVEDNPAFEAALSDLELNSQAEQSRHG